MALWQWLAVVFLLGFAAWEIYLIRRGGIEEDRAQTLRCTYPNCPCDTCLECIYEDSKLVG